MIHARFPHSPSARPGRALAFALFGLALLWVLLVPLGRALGAAGVSGPELAFWRALLAGAVFFAHAGCTRRLEPPRLRDWPLLGGFGLLGVGTVAAAFGMAAVSAQDLRFWLYLAPALLAAAFWLVSPASERKLRAVLFVALGLGTLALAGAPGAGLLWGLALGAGLAACFHFGRRLLSGHNAAGLYALGLPLGALGLWPLLDFADKSVLVWLGLLVFALSSTYFLYALVGAVLRLFGCSEALAAACGEPLAALLALAPVLGAGLGPLGLLAAALTAAPVLLLPARRSRRDPRVLRYAADGRRAGPRLHHPA